MSALLINLASANRDYSTFSQTCLLADEELVFWKLDVRELSTVCRAPGLQIVLVPWPLTMGDAEHKLLLKFIGRPFSDRPFIIGVLPPAFESQHQGEAYQSGVDDLITTAISEKHLRFKLDSIKRRHLNSDFKVSPDDINNGPLTLRVRSRSLMIQNIEIRLPLSEFAILHALFANLDTVMSRPELVLIAAQTQELSVSSIDVHICLIRKKLQEHSCLLQSVYGGGYRLTRAQKNQTRHALTSELDLQ
ncbi:MAG: response regulator transcription factor [Proteobacteria bacterium]|nr:MAG: response regulator transcription factor [Pseudomonadota bacterium]